MLRFSLLAALALSALSAAALAAPAPKKQPDKPASILVLDDCDESYAGRDEYRDTLPLLDGAGKQPSRVSGFNNCESIGSSRMVAAALGRKCVGVIENVARRIRRFDL